MNRPTPRQLSRQPLQRPQLRAFHRFMRKTHTNSSPSPPAPKTTSQARLARLESRTPSFLRPYLKPLYNAPVSHLTSFLILHELTAVGPLFALTAIFHYTDCLPRETVAEWSWVRSGLGRWERYARTKGWVSPEEVGGAVQEGAEGVVQEGVERVVDSDRGVEGIARNEGMRVVLELATAWAVTKALLPLRLVVSVWATPWFAGRVLGPAARAVGRVFR